MELNNEIDVNAPIQEVWEAFNTPEKKFLHAYLGLNSKKLTGITSTVPVKKQGRSNNSAI
ncbi:MAG: hypothetical protein Ct9H90mP30_0510 [Actinomycetota bacterium]|nr:MAG: hypothetical protein Ct9H90mP30_0510 [Actinomycetota bacterium]